MFSLRLEKLPVFHNYFNSNYNLSFGRPKIDYICEELQLKLKSPYLKDNAKRVASAELLAVSYTHLDVYKRQRLSILCLIVFPYYFIKISAKIRQMSQLA